MKNCQVCYGSVLLMDGIGVKNREIAAGHLDRDELLKPIDITEWKKAVDNGGEFSLHENNITHSSMAYTKEIAMKYPYSGGRLSDMGLDDWEMQIRMLRDNVTFGFIPDVICAYRVHDSAVTKTRDIMGVMELKSEILAGVCK